MMLYADRSLDDALEATLNGQHISVRTEGAVVLGFADLIDKMCEPLAEAMRGIVWYAALVED